MKLFRILRYFALLPLMMFCACGVVDTETPAPLIFADFETDEELDAVYWQCHTAFEQSDNKAGHGLYSLRADLPHRQYPGITFTKVPEDWSGYTTLSFWVFLEGETEQKAVLRIDDEDHGNDYGKRANMHFKLMPGENHMSFSIDEIRRNPATRLLNTQRITRIILFLVDTNKRETLYLDDFRLMKKP